MTPRSSLIVAVASHVGGARLASQGTTRKQLV